MPTDRPQITPSTPGFTVNRPKPNMVDFPTSAFKNPQSPPPTGGPVLPNVPPGNQPNYRDHGQIPTPFSTVR